MTLTVLREIPMTGQAAGGDRLLEWAERSGRRRVVGPRHGGLRFVFYGRVSTEDHQDPVTSRARQRDQAAALVAGFGWIVAEFFDVGWSRVLPWARRPQAAALLAALAGPDRGFDAIVIGECERAFYGSQYALMAPLFEHYGVQLWMPEAGGRVNFHAEGDEQMMLALGVQSKREITRTRIRVRTAMAAQARDQGRYLGGRPPYGYRLADAGPHPNKAHAAWGRRAQRLEPDPDTAPVVKWMFAQRRAGHSLARITRALNDAGIPCPSAADPGRKHPPGRAGVDPGHGAGDPGQPPLHRPAGVEPAACQPRPDRPGQHRPWPPPGAALDPARRLDHLRPSLTPSAGQRGGLHHGAGPPRRTGHRHGRRTAVPAGRAAALRDLRAAAGVLLGEQPARLPLPARAFQRRHAGPGPAEEPLHPRGPHSPARGRPACSPDQHGTRRRAGGAAPSVESTSRARSPRRTSSATCGPARSLSPTTPRPEPCGQTPRKP